MSKPAMFVPLPSPWNAAVADERAKRAAGPTPSSGTQAGLQALAVKVRTAYWYLRNAPAEE
jgi:hypothetical protein